MSGTGYKLVVLENPLLDIQAKGDDALLQKYSLKANDAVLAEKHQLGIYEDLLSRTDVKIIAGGAAQNTARGAQYLLPANSVLYIGAVGQDDAAATLDKACESAGLATEYLRLKEHPTGRCGVVITGANRSLCTDLGAANHYAISHLQSESVWRHVKNADILYVGGYHLTVCPPAAEAVARYAAENGKTFVLNMSAPFIPAVFGEQLKALIPYADYILGNETEWAAWGTSQGLSEADAKDAATVAHHAAGMPKVNKNRPRIIVVTQGTEPTVVCTASKDGQQAEVEFYPVHKLDSSKVNDTNGAGDAFAGGFMSGLVLGKSLRESVDRGSWLAKLSIQELGPSFPFPKQTYTPS